MKKLTNTKWLLVATAIIGMLASGTISMLTRVNQAQAASSSFVVTGELSIPGENHAVTRLEDKEYNVVCYGYPGSGFISCVKK